MEDHCACNRNLLNAEREQCGCHHAVTGGVGRCEAAFPDPPPQGGRRQNRERRSRTDSKMAWQREECEKHSTICRGGAQQFFFCTSRGAMCAGSAQVTFAKLRRSYNTGRNPKGKNNTRNPKQHRTKTHNHQKREATCCATLVAM